MLTFPLQVTCLNTPEQDAAAAAAVAAASSPVLCSVRRADEFGSVADVDRFAETEGKTVASSGCSHRVVAVASVVAVVAVVVGDGSSDRLPVAGSSASSP